MQPLRGKLSRRWPAEPFVARVTTNPDLPAAVRAEHVLLWKHPVTAVPTAGFAAVLAVEDTQGADELVHVKSALGYLSDGDVVLVNPPQAGLNVVYRLNSEHNALFATGRCNCRCLMCPQPPVEYEQPWHFEAILQSVRLMSPRTACLGITGGEPTLLGAQLVTLIRHCRTYLPETVLHLLTNARALQYADYAYALAEAAGAAFLVGVPLHSDLANEHDFICQAKGAFDETLRGLLNLQRFKVPVELRFVVQKETAGRMTAFSRFVARNLPFVNQVAFMGLETVGFGWLNKEAAWIDPLDVQAELEEAVLQLDCRGINVALFNMQHCVLPKSLWPFSRRSISDWKNEYLPVCAECGKRGVCAGFFALDRARPSRGITPIPAES